jgi:hypothetical protein
VVHHGVGTIAVEQVLFLLQELVLLVDDLRSLIKLILQLLEIGLLEVLIQSLLLIGNLSVLS